MSQRGAREFPLAMPVAWSNGRFPHAQGNVIGHGADGRLKVRNRFSAKEYWIYPARVVAP